MLNLIKQDGGVNPAKKTPQKGKVVISANLKKESVTIDRYGNIISSKNPHEAVVIGKPLFTE